MSQRSFTLCAYRLIVKAGSPFLLYEEQHRIVELKGVIGIILFRVTVKNTLFLSVFAYFNREAI